MLKGEKGGESGVNMSSDGSIIYRYIELYMYICNCVHIYICKDIWAGFPELGVPFWASP